MTNYLRCESTVANDKLKPKKSLSAHIVKGLKGTFYISCTSNFYLIDD